MKALPLPSQQFCCTLYDTARALTVASNVPAMLGLLAERATEALNIKASSVRLLDKKGEILTLAAAYGLSAEYLKKGPVKVEKSLVDKEALAGKAVTILDVTTDPRWQYPEEAKREGIVSVLCVPIAVKQKNIGTVRAYSSSRHEFNEEEAQFLYTMASQVGAALENVKLTQRLRRQYEDLKILVDVSRKITSQLRLKDVLDSVVTETAKVMNAKGCALRLLDERKTNLELGAAHGLSEEYLKKGPIEPSKSLAEALEGKPVVVTDVTKDARIQYPEEARREGICSILGAPVIFKDEVIGTIRIYDEKPREFEEEEIEFLSGVAAQSAIAIQNARLYKIALANWQELVQEVSQRIDLWGTPTTRAKS
ncbi:MAG: GAF domain-containing protein [Aigarchaeota archaeon]|nr:GAF domain-containing protein [Aigarchaeota archaeon]